MCIDNMVTTPPFGPSTVVARMDHITTNFNNFKLTERNGTSNCCCAVPQYPTTSRRRMELDIGLVTRMPHHSFGLLLPQAPPQPIDFQNWKCTKQTTKQEVAVAKNERPLRKRRGRAGSNKQRKSKRAHVQKNSTFQQCVADNSGEAIPAFL
eukprot:TRINITY_DN67613_c9_g4_i2.p2 TRINITY_DN67613_c9_g4~~TRINITY_DN67613_c9_g4_i2.p2  ORF type:complete len:152 (+),score=20.79 TRINITY_DN67613_c9_g4_i2:55-510(+)